MALWEWKIKWEDVTFESLRTAGGEKEWIPIRPFVWNILFIQF